MTDGSDSEIRPAAAPERGLLRLMLKLPAMRGRLQLLAARSAELGELLGAYDDAARMMERLAKEPGQSTQELRREYETIVSELESDVIAFCLRHRDDDPGTI